MKIACDWDGSLADTHTLVCEMINFKHGTFYTRNNITSWDFWRDLGLEDDFWAIYDIMDKSHLRRAIKPVSPFACPTLKALLQHGHEVEVLTSNSERAARDMAAWDFGHGIDVHVRALGRVSAREKAALDYDLFIDDAPALVEAMSDFPNKRMILVDQPWNRAIKLPPNVYRLQHWEDALTALKLMGVL